MDCFEDKAEAPAKTEKRKKNLGHHKRQRPFLSELLHFRHPPLLWSEFGSLCHTGRNSEKRRKRVWTIFTSSHHLTPFLAQINSCHSSQKKDFITRRFYTSLLIIFTFYDRYISNTCITNPFTQMTPHCNWVKSVHLNPNLSPYMVTVLSWKPTTEFLSKPIYL